MIHLPPKQLSGRASSWLLRWQNEVDTFSTYAERVAEAKRVWPLRNVKANKTFEEARSVLAGMTSGHVRCAYCEDSLADEIDHIQPKDVYPERVFAWENYLFACGACNGEKRNNYAVFTGAGGNLWVDVKRKASALVVPPISGEPLLINPRHENPLHFLLLDITATFVFVPPPWLTPREQERTKYTIDTLELNDRDPLREGRRTAFIFYKNTLHRYVDLRSDAVAQGERDNCVAALKNGPHTTVWQEMKRWHVQFPGTIPPINALFDAAPEALAW